MPYGSPFSNPLGQPSFGGYQTTAPSPAPQAGGQGFWGGVANSPLTPAIIQFLGGLLGGYSQGKQADKQREEQRRQFDTNTALQEKQFAADEAERQRHVQSLGATTDVRKAIMQAMAQRLGLQLPNGPTAQPAPPGGKPWVGPGSGTTPPNGPGNIPTPKPVPLPAPAPGGKTPDELRAALGIKAPPTPEQLAAIRNRVRTFLR